MTTPNDNNNDEENAIAYSSRYQLRKEKQWLLKKEMKGIILTIEGDCHHHHQHQHHHEQDCW